MKYAELCARLDSNTWDPDDHRQAAAAIRELEGERVRYEMADAAMAECRRLCKEIIGDNLAFVDDDVARCLVTLRDRLAEMEAENARLTAANKARDEFLRGLLREARGEMAWRPSIKPLLARIDAALAKVDA